MIIVLREQCIQLDLLGRGPDALRGAQRADDSDVTVARGSMARVPRRVKAGHRELLKLDLVEAELGEPGGSETERLDALATPLTDAVAELCEKLPTRTLLVVSMFSVVAVSTIGISCCPCVTVGAMSVLLLTRLIGTFTVETAVA